MGAAPGLQPGLVAVASSHQVSAAASQSTEAIPRSATAKSRPSPSAADLSGEDTQRLIYGIRGINYYWPPSLNCSSIASSLATSHGGVSAAAIHQQAGGLGGLSGLGNARPISTARHATLPYR